MDGLTFDAVPELPQVTTLKRVSSALWGRRDVAALWLGGSFARGEADGFSDLDLRVAVASDSFDAWSMADPSSLIGEPVVGVQSIAWDRTVLHHSVLGSGVILDLLVQSADREPPEDYTLVLGCRDAAFGRLLSGARLPPTEEFAPADPTAIRDAVISFWIGSHKHVRMLHRGLDLLVLIGLGMEQSVLMRLWYAEATGRDQGTQRATIHTLTPTVRAVTEATGSHCLETLGSARTCRAEIVSVVEANRDEVAAVGRRLAARLGFEYPEALEETVRRTWRQSLHASLGGQRWPTPAPAALSSRAI